MKAQLISTQTPGGRRSMLASELPLATPYLVQVFPTYACNFKCNYCVLSLPKSQRGYIADQKFLDFDIYRKCIDEIAKFPDKLRMLRFAGTGEPLLHPKIASMVEYAAIADVAHSIDIVTNGALLTAELSQSLVRAGVSRIRISIQGVTREQYLATTGTYADLEKIVDNVAFLYSIREKTELYVKIIDSAIETAENEREFFQLFGDIADSIAIEHLLPATPLIDYTRIAKSTIAQTQNGAPLSAAEVCPQPFYMMQLNPDGIIVPCCAMESPLRSGNLSQESVQAIWNGSEINRFRRMQLNGKRSDNPVCRTCQQFRHGMFPEDVLDQDALSLLRGYPEATNQGTEN